MWFEPSHTNPEGDLHTLEPDGFVFLVLFLSSNKRWSCDCVRTLKTSLIYEHRGEMKARL